MMSLPEQIKEQLMNEYKYRIEMHAHTKPVSRCSEVPPEKMAEIYSELGYDAVVISNHFIQYMYDGYSKEEAIDHYLKGYEDTCAAAKKMGLHIILAAEIRFNENHNDYLIYGVDREVLGNVYDYFEKGLKAFRTEVKLDKSVFVQAHPFRNGMELVSPGLLDGMETFNLHPSHNARIGQAVRYALDNKLEITTAGTDFHHLDVGHEGLAAVRTRILPGDSFELAEILRKRDYIIEIGRNAIVLP